MSSSFQAETLQRIHSALESAREIFARFTLGAIEAEYKAGHDPVTEADRAVDAVLRHELLRAGEGWLSEESVDDLSRLEKKRVWIVDPLDGTRVFVAGIPELVRPGEDGWLFPAGDVDALAAAMRDCLEATPEALARMGERARERVLRRHDVDTEAAKLVALFAASAAARVVPRPATAEARP